MTNDKIELLRDQIEADVRSLTEEQLAYLLELIQNS